MLKPSKRLSPLLAAAIAVTLCGSLGCNRLGGMGGAPDPKTDDDKVFYALGEDIGKNIDVFSLQPHELEMVKAGLSDAIGKRKAKVELDTIRPKIYEMAKKRQEARVAMEKKSGKEAVEKAAKEPGAEKLALGTVIKTVRAGTGASPVETDTVKVNYEGRLLDGTVFDSSFKRNQPAEFGLKNVIRCWTEGMQRMKVGGKAQLTCPSELAYGEQGFQGKIPPGSTLTFDVELLDIVTPKAPPVSVPPPAAAAAAMAAPASNASKK